MGSLALGSLLGIEGFGFRDLGLLEVKGYRALGGMLWDIASLKP